MPTCLQLEVKSAEGTAREAILAEVLRELNEARSQAARRAEESAHREAELGEQLAKVSAELAESKASSQKFWNTVNKDKDAKLQVRGQCTIDVLSSQSDTCPTRGKNAQLLFFH